MYFLSKSFNRPDSISRMFINIRNYEPANQYSPILENLRFRKDSFLEIKRTHSWLFCSVSIVVDTAYVMHEFNSISMRTYHEIKRFFCQKHNINCEESLYHLLTNHIIVLPWKGQSDSYGFQVDKSIVHENLLFWHQFG